LKTDSYATGNRIEEIQKFTVMWAQQTRPLVVIHGRLCAPTHPRRRTYAATVLSLVNSGTSSSRGVFVNDTHTRLEEEERWVGLGRRRANQRPKPSTQRKQTTASRQATNDNDTAAIMAGAITDVVGVSRES